MEIHPAFRQLLTKNYWNLTSGNSRNLIIPLILFYRVSPKGTKSADLPAWQSAKAELMIGRKAAKALGFTIPESFLLACEVFAQSAHVRMHRKAFAKVGCNGLVGWCRPVTGLLRRLFR